jgi:GNAT superfamily N-acetyltransferase
MSNFTITPGTEKDAEFIVNSLLAYNHAQVPFTQSPASIPKNYIIKDGDEIIAGLNASIYRWKILFVDMFFVDPHYRGKDLGTTLLKHAEDEARAMGVTLSHLDTFDFQAKDFYIKQGYEVFGVLDDCPKDHKRYYLKKLL